jgi:TIR domain
LVFTINAAMLQSSLPRQQIPARSIGVDRLTRKLASLKAELAQLSERVAVARGRVAITRRRLQPGEDDRRLARQLKLVARAEKKAGEVERTAERVQRRLLAERGRSSSERDASGSARPFPGAAPPGLPESYDVCLSFAGEQRAYVKAVALDLVERGLSVFYDQDEEIESKLWGADLGEYLDYVYRQASRFCVMFISADYASKAWTVHERRSAMAAAIVRGEGYVLPVRFDDTELPGLRPTVGYLDLRKTGRAKLVDLILKKLEAA